MSSIHTCDICGNTFNNYSDIPAKINNIDYCKLCLKKLRENCIHDFEEIENYEFENEFKCKNCWIEICNYNSGPNKKELNEIYYLVYKNVLQKEQYEEYLKQKEKFKNYNNNIYNKIITEKLKKLL